MLMKLDPEPTSILDVGPGAGQWFDLLKPWFPDVRFDAIEIFQPYVERYQLDKKYDNVFVGDARKLFAGRNLDGCFLWDLVVFGDVLEHMKRDEARAVVDNLLLHYALISIPIGPCPQDPTEENPYEEHLCEWSTEDVLATFPVIDYFSYQFPPPHYGRGVFLLKKGAERAG